MTYSTSTTTSDKIADIFKPASIIDEPIYQNKPVIHVSADDLTLMKQVKAGIEAIILALQDLPYVSIAQINLHVTTGIVIAEAWHRDGTSARTSFGTGMVKNTSATIIAQAVLKRLLKYMNKPVPSTLTKAKRQHVGDLWLPY